jgi:DNA primase
MRLGGGIVGLKLRMPDGMKLCAKGSRLGLIVPPTFNADAQEMWLTEGESDLMAAVGAWGLNAVARPGCTACSGEVARLSAGKHLVILADNDKPGKEGAARLADACKSAKTVTVLAPPAKDVREWVKRGATVSDVRWRLKSRRGW